MKKKVLILGADVNRKNHGGVVTFTKGLLNSPLKDRYDLDVERFEFRGKGIAKLLNLPRDMKVLRKKLEAGKFDIVHANVSIYQLSFFKVWLYTSMKKRFGFKLLVHLHGGMIENIRFFRKYFVQTLSKADQLIFLSEPQKAGFDDYKNLQTKILILPNFLASDAPSPNGLVEKKLTTFLFIARVVREKGIFDLLDAIIGLTPEEKEKTRLLVCGTGDALEEAKAYAAKNKLNNCVEFLGFVKGASKEKAFQESDVCVLPTYWDEGFPFTILEAMSWGLSVISTDKGAIGEVILDGENGYIVRPKDPEQLRERILELVNSETKKQKFSANNRRRFHEYYDMNGPGVKAFSSIYEALTVDKK